MNFSETKSNWKNSFEDLECDPQDNLMFIKKYKCFAMDNKLKTFLIHLKLKLIFFVYH